MRKAQSHNQISSAGRVLGKNDLFVYWVLFVFKDVSCSSKPAVEMQRCGAGCVEGVLEKLRWGMSKGRLNLNCNWPTSTSLRAF